MRCRKPGCNRAAVAKGYCASHFTLLRKILTESMPDSEIIDQIDIEAPETNPEVLLSMKQGNQVMREVLSRSPVREQRVLIARFGVGVERDCSLEEVGKFLSLSRERIHQIEKAAMRKLRHPVRRKRLREFI